MESPKRSAGEPKAPEAEVEAPSSRNTRTTDPSSAQLYPAPRKAPSPEVVAPDATTSGPPPQEPSPSVPPAPDKGTKKRRRSQDPSGDFTRLPGVTDEPLRNDLADFGFCPEKVMSLVKQQQPLFDKWRDPNCKEGKMQAEREKKAKGEADRKRRKLMEKYEPLYLEGNSNWVLFDPLVHTFPAIRDDQPEKILVPSNFAKFERFQLGNSRIVEINLAKSSVRLRSAPSSLEGKNITYEQTGPKIVEDKVDEVVVEAAPVEVASLPPPPKKKGRPGRPRKTRAPVFSSPTKSPPKKKAKPAIAVVKPKPVQRPKMRKPVNSKELVEDSDSELSNLEEQ